MLGFRVWEFNKRMVYKHPYAIDHDGKIIADDGFYVEEFQAIPMQSTGMQDSLGDIIYEGDIVKYIYFDKPGQALQIVREAKEFWALYPSVAENMAAFKIIGNIYENPELLEKIK